MTARRLDMAESVTARENARAVTRRAYARLYKQALDAGNKFAAQRYQQEMEKLERKWGEDG